MNSFLDEVEDSRRFSEIRGAEPIDLDLTLWEAFLQASEDYPEREAIVSLWQFENPEFSIIQQSYRPEESTSILSWTYRTLRNRAEQLAAGLERLGCQRDMRVAASLCNSAEWVLFFWACARLRITFAPLDPTVSVEERTTIIKSLKPHIIVVQDAEAALGIQEFDTEPHFIKIRCSNQDVVGWIRLCDVMWSNEIPKIMSLVNVTEDHHNVGNNDTTSKTVALVVSTSGTTGDSKFCQHTDRNLLSQSCDFDPEPDPSVIHRWLVHTPTFHIFAINNALRAWRTGGVVIFPSRSFNVNSTLNALVKEQCSIMSANPSLLRALISQPSFPQPEALSLHLVTLGGTEIGLADFRLCRQRLGADHAIQVYGMSECGPLITWKRSDPMLVDGYHSGVDKVLPGGAVRICRYRSRRILPWSEVGELHISGSSVIESYMNSFDNCAFYKEGSDTWFMTGDQAMIDEQGILHILGRYKDLIIRGGENISPVKIELKLRQLAGLQAYVVGVPNDVAGQVPIAIVASSGELNKAQVLQQASDMGPKYSLDSVYTLDELGMREFPVTSTGKVKKEELKRMAMEYRGRNHFCGFEDGGNGLHVVEAGSNSLTDQLIDVWQQLTGLRPAKDDSVIYLGDSITLLRYCEKVLRACGMRLYLQDFIENDTLAKQAHLLNTRAQQQAKFDVASGKRVSGHGETEATSRIVPVSHLTVNGHGDLSKTLQNSSTEQDFRWEMAQEAAFRMGLKGSKVVDILSIRESLHRTVVGQRPQSFQNRMVFGIRGIHGMQIRRGLERALSLQPLMRSIVLVPAGQGPYHAILSPDESLFSQLIHEVEVATEEEIVGLAKNESPERHCGPFMFQSNLVKVGDGKLYYLVMTFSHSVIDAMSLSHWYRELDELIIDPSAKIAALTPYKLFDDLFTQYEYSAPAQENVRYHIRKLRGISRFRNALWPPQQAPGWMVSNDEGAVFARQRRDVRNKIWKGKWEIQARDFQYPRCCRAVWLPGLAQLKKKHGVHPSLLTKCGLVIFNVLQTGSSQAIFTVWESGRSWPFVPQWMETLLPPAMSIDGPTVQWILNMIEVVRNETVAEFFRRIKFEQEQDRLHEHVPWGQVVQGLRDEGEVAVDASYRQSFVWDVSLGVSASRTSGIDFTKLEPKARYGWADNGIYWNAFSIDKDNIYFIASWDTAQMNDIEIDGYCDCLAECIRKLAEEANWEKTMAEVFGI